MGSCHNHPDREGVMVKQKGVYMRLCAECRGEKPQAPVRRVTRVREQKDDERGFPR